MAYQAVVFDLDGTLIDTLGDLAAALNAALVRHDLPERAESDIRRMIGNGVRKLVERACPPGSSVKLVDQVLASFNERYLAACCNRSLTYPGIVELLGCLQARGVLCALVSNKPDAAVRPICDHYLSDMLAAAYGERVGVARKPAADGVLLALDELGVDVAEAVYVGDSPVDLATAQAAGMSCILVSWGYGDLSGLEGVPIVHTTDELKRALLD